MFRRSFAFGKSVTRLFTVYHLVEIPARVLIAPEGIHNLSQSLLFHFEMTRLLLLAWQYVI